MRHTLLFPKTGLVNICLLLGMLQQHYLTYSACLLQRLNFGYYYKSITVVVEIKYTFCAYYCKCVLKLVYSITSWNNFSISLCYSLEATNQFISITKQTSYYFAISCTHHTYLFILELLFVKLVKLSSLAALSR